VARHALPRTTCSYFVWRSMRGPAAIPAHVPHPLSSVLVQVNVGSECLEFKAKGRAERKS
jgi:hypothetical protein